MKKYIFSIIIISMCLFPAANVFGTAANVNDQPEVIITGSGSGAGFEFDGSANVNFSCYVPDGGGTYIISALNTVADTDSAIEYATNNTMSRYVQQQTTSGGTSDLSSADLSDTDTWTDPSVSSGGGESGT